MIPPPSGSTPQFEQALERWKRANEAANQRHPSLRPSGRPNDFRKPHPMRHNPRGSYAHRNEYLFPQETALAAGQTPTAPTPAPTADAAAAPMGRTRGDIQRTVGARSTNQLRGAQSGLAMLRSVPAAARMSSPSASVPLTDNAGKGPVSAGGDDVVRRVPPDVQAAYNNYTNPPAGTGGFRPTREMLAQFAKYKLVPEPPNGAAGPDMGAAAAAAMAASAPPNRSDYGAFLNLPPGSRVDRGFIDRDGDRIDDRYQTGPGQPRPVRPKQRNSTANA